MASRVILFSSAQADFASIAPTHRPRIANALRELIDFPLNRIGIKKLKPPFEGYRKRVGDFRISFDAKGDAVTVHRIKHRKDAYR